MIRIRDTLRLGELEVSEALLKEMKEHPRVTSMAPPAEWTFDSEGNLPPLDL